ncbi:methyltransferase domain-containing protein [Paracoccaceae bacterium]|jgi:SAM-dependent methyltransferase|nr:methyltransferase domain-containing protein [Paracoccaceae bacterium]
MSKKMENYWNRYYSDKKNLSLPSQFATFILNEFFQKNRFVDIGCGDGRDSLFFATYGKKVLGLDGSSSAINFCQNKALEKSLSEASFQQLQINDSNECDTFVAKNHKNWSGSLLYARFFLHAIDEVAEQNFLQLSSDLVGDNGHICLEFRTPRDRFQNKETEAHYRRYVEPLDFLLQARAYGLDCVYFVEGFGFAKYKSDDAYVARLILEKV